MQTKKVREDSEQGKYPSLKGKANIASCQMFYNFFIMVMCTSTMFSPLFSSCRILPVILSFH